MRDFTRDFAVIGSELDHVDDVERQPRQFRQLPGERGLAATGIAEHRHPFHAACSVTAHGL